MDKLGPQYQLAIAKWDTGAREWVSALFDLVKDCRHDVKFKHAGPGVCRFCGEVVYVKGFG